LNKSNKNSSSVHKFSQLKSFISIGSMIYTADFGIKNLLFR